MREKGRGQSVVEGRRRGGREGKEIIEIKEGEKREGRRRRVEEEEKEEGTQKKKKKKR